MKLRRRGYLVEGMVGGTYIGTKELPNTLRSVLKKVGYKKSDILVVPTRTIQTGSFRSDQGFVVVVNLATGESSDVVRGSWEEQDNESTTVPVDGAVIVGDRDKGVSAIVYANPKTITAMTSGEIVTEREADILKMASYGSFYKKSLFELNRVMLMEIESLVARGYMKKNKVGATSLTTRGKNVMSKKHFLGGKHVFEA